jgi:hypothetical protein
MLPQTTAPRIRFCAGLALLVVIAERVGRGELLHFLFGMKLKLCTFPEEYVDI